MTAQPSYASPIGSPRASGPGMTVVGIVTIAAPVVAVLAKLPSFGWLMVFVVFTGYLWVAGYVVLVLAVALGMLRRRGVLRTGPRRVRATVWGLLTSVGVVLLGLTVIDGGDTRESIQSTLTVALGSPESPSPAHSVSEAIAWVAGAAWIVGYVGLVVEWIAGAASARSARTPAAPRVAPPVVR